MSPATTRPPANSSGFWLPGQGDASRTGGASARQWLGERGYAVGSSAQAARPNASKMRWRDIAQMAGVTDFRGAKKDDRFGDIQAAYYGHNASAAGEDPTRTAYRNAIDTYLRENEGQYAAGGDSIGTGAGAGGGGSTGQPGFEGELEMFLRKAMSGEEGPFDATTRQNMRASAKEDAAGQLAAANRMANLSAARTGNLYSGSAQETAAENTRAADAALGSGFRSIDVQGAQANFDAKLKSRDQALSLLQQRKEEAIANARNALEARRIGNEYDIAIQQIAVDREKIAADKAAADSAARAEMASGRAWREHELEKLNLQHGWDVDQFANEQLPFLLGEYGD
jgi:hypothetical protein